MRPGSSLIKRTSRRTHSPPADLQPSKGNRCSIAIAVTIAAGRRAHARPGRLRRRRRHTTERRAPRPPDQPGGGEAGGTIAIITVDPSNPYWKAEVDTAEAEAKKLGYTDHHGGPQERSGDPEPVDRDRDQRQGQGHPARPGRRRREHRGGAEGGRRGHPGGADQRRDQPDRAGQGPDRLQQRPGRHPRRRGVGEGHGLQGHLRRTVREAERQQRPGALRRLQAGHLAVPRPEVGRQGDRELGPPDGPGEDGVAVVEEPRRRRASSPATTRWRSARSTR